MHARAPDNDKEMVPLAKRSCRGEPQFTPSSQHQYLGNVLWPQILIISSVSAELLSLPPSPAFLLFVKMLMFPCVPPWALSSYYCRMFLLEAVVHIAPH